MAIVHVVDRVRAGHGRCLSALAIARAQRCYGWDVRLLVSGVDDAELLVDIPNESLFTDATRPIYRNVRAIDDITAALGRLTGPHDVVVGHHGVTLAAACRLPAHRVVGAVHSDPQDCLGYLAADDLRRVVRRIDCWVAWGPHTAGQLCGWLGIDQRRVVVSAQAVEPWPAGVHVLDGSPACLTVAGVRPVKNHGLMLRALGLLAEELPDVRWHMVGPVEDDGYLAELQGLGHRLGVERRVRWYGLRSDVGTMMLGADVVVLASRSEGVPRAIQEAMVLGVPTVMPRALVGGLRHAGLPVTYERAEPAELAAAVQTACRTGASQCAAAARRVARRWSWEAVLDDWRQALAS